MPIRPPSSVESAIFNPSPGAPSIDDFGTRHSSKERETVSDPLIPILRSRFPTENPFVPGSTRKALTLRGDFCVSAMTIVTQACSPFVMKFFDPSRMNPSPFSRANVDRPPASEPAPGSVSANAPAPFPPESIGRWRLRCASVPNRKIASPVMLVTAIPTPVEAHPPATSRRAMA